jgi:hypothetical protein
VETVGQPEGIVAFLGRKPGEPGDKAGFLGGFLNFPPGNAGFLPRKPALSGRKAGFLGDKPAFLGRKVTMSGRSVTFLGRKPALSGRKMCRLTWPEKSVQRLSINLQRMSGNGTKRGVWPLSRCCPCFTGCISTLFLAIVRRKRGAGVHACGFKRRPAA